MCSIASSLRPTFGRRPYFPCALALAVQIATGGHAAEDGARPFAPALEGLGSYHQEITTTSTEARRAFDQGMMMLYGFNHAEAKRSFLEVTRLDPDCAMGYWGFAYACGPNINAPMTADSVAEANEAVKRARELADRATPRERALIQAIGHRYPAEPVDDRSQYDEAYARSMREAAALFPEDPDVQTLFAEALLDTMPWNYHEPDGSPRPATIEVVSTLERVLANHPDHPGANHFYIHAVEASRNPERGLEAARRLATIAPGVGHLVHMPAHIYLRTGDYKAASEANEKAARADEAYFERCKERGFYPAMYYAHNLHFLAYSRALEGRARPSLDAARRAAAAVTDQDVLREPGLQQTRTTPLLILIRFERWDELLEEPEPSTKALFQHAIWSAARVVALSRTGRIDDAVRELATMETAATSADLKALENPFFPVTRVIAVALDMARAESQLAQGQLDAAIRDYSRAVATEDSLPYMEPPYWFLPLRPRLATLQIDAERPQEAEATLRKDLIARPGNGWALSVLARALRSQGKEQDARAIEAQLEPIRRDASFPPTLPTR